MIQVIEWWLSPIDVYGDSIEVYYCDSRQEALEEKTLSESDHPDAVEWRLEKVVRLYSNDGELQEETITEIEC